MLIQLPAPILSQGVDSGVRSEAGSIVAAIKDTLCMGPRPPANAGVLAAYMDKYASSRGYGTYVLATRFDLQPPAPTPVLMPRNTELLELFSGNDLALRQAALLEWQQTGSWQALNGSVTIRGRHLIHNGNRAKILGQGGFGIVYDHPVIPGLVIKLMVLNSYQWMSLFDERPIIDYETEYAKRLAGINVGPQYLGRIDIEGVAGLVREKVEGMTLEAILDQHKLSIADYELIIDMIVTLVKNGIEVPGLKLRNVIIGTTPTNSKRQAYLFDADRLAYRDVNLTMTRDDTLVRDFSFLVNSGYSSLGGGHYASYAPLIPKLKKELARSKNRH